MATSFPKYNTEGGRPAVHEPGAQPPGGRAQPCPQVCGAPAAAAAEDVVSSRKHTTRLVTRTPAERHSATYLASAFQDSQGHRTQGQSGEPLERRGRGRETWGPE